MGSHLAIKSFQFSNYQIPQCLNFARRLELDFYRPLRRSSLCAFSLRGGGLGLWEFCFGAECVVFDECCAARSFTRLSLDRVPPDALPVDAPAFTGGVNGRKPSFGPPLFPAGDATRASFGDISGV